MHGEDLKTPLNPSVDGLGNNPAAYENVSISNPMSIWRKYVPSSLVENC